MPAQEILVDGHKYILAAPVQFAVDQSVRYAEHNGTIVSLAIDIRDSKGWIIVWFPSTSTILKAHAFTCNTNFDVEPGQPLKIVPTRG